MTTPRRSQMTASLFQKVERPRCWTGGTSSILDNDTDTDLPNDELTLALLDGPPHGDLVLNEDDGTFSYTHHGGEESTDSFTYKLTDAVGAVTVGTVSIVITAENDSSTVDVNTGLTLDEGTAAPITNLLLAVSDADNGPEEITELTTTDVVGDGGDPNNFGVLVNDADLDLPNDTLAVNTTPVVPPEHGELTLNTDGTFTYTHDGSEYLTDSFSYEVSDSAGNTDVGTVTLTMTPINTSYEVNASLVQAISTHRTSEFVGVQFFPWRLTWV